MTDNPYSAPTSGDLDRSLSPIRLRRGRKVLIMMALILLTVFLWAVFNDNLHHGWSLFPMQLARLAVPLSLIYAIWKGRSWARVVLGILCVVILAANVSMLTDIPAMLRADATGDVVLAILMTGGYTVVFLFTAFSNALTGLIYFRRDEKELS